MKNLLDKMFPSQVDALAPMIYAEREMYGQEKRRVAVLLAALKAVEWLYEEGSMIQTCPWCRSGQLRGHDDDCQRQQAIAAAEGDTDDN